jgi:hypothetical protein
MLVEFLNAVLDKVEHGRAGLEAEARNKVLIRLKTSNGGNQERGRLTLRG